jgi:SAM-dependent methyltransferase
MDSSGVAPARGRAATVGWAGRENGATLTTSEKPRDALLETDWIAHWRGLVERHAADSSVAPQPGYWDRRAAGFAFSTQGQDDPFLRFLEPWLGPRKTLIDVGAGVGRHVRKLVERLDWVTAVEPSEGMRKLIPDAPNLTVIASSWEDAVPQRADLVICCHVLYGVAEVEPFLRKLDASAAERVFVYLRDRQTNRPVDALWSELAQGRARMPQFGDLYNVLRQAGIAPDVTMLKFPTAIRYQSLDEALTESREALGEHWDETRGRAFLESHLTLGEDGSLTWDGGTMTAGVAHWTPAS